MSPRTIEGLDIRNWHTRAVRNRREINRLRHIARAHATPVITLTLNFLCIHNHEGSWTDTGAPYYGGLQMNYDFQKTYGRQLLTAKGTADKWSPSEQIAVAIVAHASRGFQPWPTRRYCGL